MLEGKLKIHYSSMFKTKKKTKKHYTVRVKSRLQRIRWEKISQKLVTIVIFLQLVREKKKRIHFLILSTHNNYRYNSNCLCRCRLCRSRSICCFLFLLQLLLSSNNLHYKHFSISSHPLIQLSQPIPPISSNIYTRYYHYNLNMQKMRLKNAFFFFRRDGSRIKSFF